jgi:S-formylglutathione hydrolase FrmB
MILAWRWLLVVNFGDFMGAYGALKFAILYPEQFSLVYALHPVATGTGWVPMSSRPDWSKIHKSSFYPQAGRAWH